MSCSSFIGYNNKFGILLVHHYIVVLILSLVKVINEIRDRYVRY